MLFAAAGLFGGAYFHLRTDAKPIVVAIFIATGIAALVYRFLGGITDTTFTIKSLKLGGTMAALLGSAFAINSALERQMRPVALFSVRKPADLVGRWKWQWAEGQWLGYLDFSEEREGLIFRDLCSELKVNVASPHNILTTAGQSSSTE